MNMLANSIRDNSASIRSSSALNAPAPGRPSSGRQVAACLLAATWSLLPAVLGFVLASVLADQWLLALIAMAGHQGAAWALTIYTGGPVPMTRGRWLCVLVGGGVTIAIGAPTVLPWLFLPVLPALLLRSACRHGPMRSVGMLMRIFSVAALAAALMQLAACRPEAGMAIAVLGATLLCLLALERLVVAGHSDVESGRQADPRGEP